MLCRQCGNRLELGSLFCAGCGAKAITTPVSGPHPMHEKGNSIFSARTEGFVESLQPKGFFEALFDFSFTSLITTKLIKVLYINSIGVLALISLLFVAISFTISQQAGVVMLLFGAPLFFLLGVCYTRVMLEIMIVLFRIAEHTAEIAQQGRMKETPGEIKTSSE